MASGIESVIFASKVVAKIKEIGVKSFMRRLYKIWIVDIDVTVCRRRARIETKSLLVDVSVLFVLEKKMFYLQEAKVKQILEFF